MKVSEKWLREWANPTVSVEQLVEQLTMAGLEVDSLEQIDAGFSDVVVGEILSVEPHPDAEKLQVCQVADGMETAQVVCGAPNAAKGQKVPFARVGAKLPGEMKIKKAKLRGVESFGMLCGGPELELNDDDSGLMVLPGDAPVGAALEDYLGLNDAVLELDITPNRGDCFNVLGISREVAVMNGMAASTPAVDSIAPQIDDVFPVTIEAPVNCPVYCGRVIRGIDNSVATPIWMQEKLRRSGLRSIDPVVDITNYVLLELGQPMHGFDLQRLEDGIVVRLAADGEEITLLDGQLVQLHRDTLVIADSNGPKALAGIMGGIESGVSEDTVDIFLESAFFAPLPLAGQPRRYGLHTDSSLRFERGVDHCAQQRAIERATELLLEITGGIPGPVTCLTSEESLPIQSQIHLRKIRIAKYLGLDLEEEAVESILHNLGFKSEQVADGWQVTAPSWRFDIELEVDLLEELARVYGYNRLPTRSLTVPLQLRKNSEGTLGKTEIRRQLVARKYQEVITYSFVEPGLLQLFTPGDDPVELANPISSDMAAMRTSLMPGLVSTAAYNLNRQQQRVRLFETGLRFRRTADGHVDQQAMLAGVICGPRQEEHWDGGEELVDFFDLKGDLQALIALSGRQAEFNFEAAVHPALHDGQSASISLGGLTVGWIGCIHPRVQQAMDLSLPMYLFEIELASLSEAKLPRFAELSRFPEVRRDLAVVVDEAITADEVLKSILASAGENLHDLTLFDIYQGKGIEKQRKSFALGLTYRHQSRTLKDREINESIDGVIQALKNQFNAMLRN